MDDVFNVIISNGIGTATNQVADNSITTSKYTVLNFAPKNLYEQLQKFGNSYFLFISIVMYAGEKTDWFIGTIKAFSTLGMLMMMMSVTAIMALLDDLRRKEADKATNTSACNVVDSSFQSLNRKSWQDVKVGDLLVVERDDELCADVVALYCSGDEGTCYVSTANLDGETNLKIKAAHEHVQKMFNMPGSRREDVYKKLQTIKGTVESEKPTANIENYSGRLRLQTPSVADVPLEMRNLLLRGTVLRNTDWCLGIVVYTGAQTRVMMNSRPAPIKQSNLERTTNWVMLVILASQAGLAVISDTLYLINKEIYHSAWYLIPPDILFPDWFGYFLTFFVLYSNMMPISLYPTLEVLNAAQAYFIKNDRHMCYQEFNFPAGVRSSNLCQEIGQVAYIFSDKTGTLTQNVMELKRLWIAGTKYGTMTKDKGFNGKEDILRDWRNGKTSDIDLFFEVLAVCHTVAATREQKTNKLLYEAESPDDLALVNAASELGYCFEGKVNTRINVEISPLGTPSNSYTVLALNAFNSTRKRMSMVVEKDNKYFLLVKGADNVILERSVKKYPDLVNSLSEFSKEGLRTLVIARRELSKDQLEKWKKTFDAAERALTDRDKALSDAAEEIEKDLIIVGATAIEDKLQDGVPETIIDIRAAGIKLWVLTGDKLETAREIGFSAQVLDSGMLIETMESGSDLDRAATNIRNTSKICALMVTGGALSHLMATETSKTELLDVAKLCSIVIACRVSPAQKALMVMLVRNDQTVKGNPPVTLAIGDGANDVPMIQEAQVGVGICGREGRQAVNNSDFSIGQFRYLRRLLLVHGRWNYRRGCKCTLFTFWRNVVQVLMIFYYTFMSGYSGTSLFEDYIRLTFNALCSLPIIVTGCFDQDVDEKTALQQAHLYNVGRQGRDLSIRRMLHTLFSAFVHSAVLMGVTMAAFPTFDLHHNGDYYTFGTVVYSALLIDMNYRVAFLNYTHNQFTVGSIVLSFVLYAFWLWFYPCNLWAADLLAPNMYMISVHMVQSLMFWLCMLVVPLMAMSLDVFAEYCFQISNLVSHEVFELRQRARTDSGMEPEHHVTDSEVGGLSRSLNATLEEETWAAQQQWADQQPTDDQCRRYPLDISDLGQQKLIFKYKWVWNPTNIATSLLALGAVLLAIGALTISVSIATPQVRIHYAGANGGDPFLTVPEEVYEIQDKCDESICTVKVSITDSMPSPILVYYAMGPFFQNYNDYLKSEVVPELEGKNVPDAKIKAKCLKDVREDPSGNRLVPCGMKATSFFNDTYAIEGLELSTDGVAWVEDMDRYQNPSDYPHRPRTSWLYERFPSISKDDGVNDPHFVSWMRPSATWRVWNPYGYIYKDLKAGDVLNITINSVYPIGSFGESAYKQLVLTNVGELGARNPGFGAFMLIFGTLNICMALIVWAVSHFGCATKVEESLIRGRVPASG